MLNQSVATIAPLALCGDAELEDSAAQNQRLRMIERHDKTSAWGITVCLIYYNMLCCIVWRTGRAEFQNKTFLKTLLDALNVIQDFGLIHAKLAAVLSTSVNMSRHPAAYQCCRSWCPSKSTSACKQRPCAGHSISIKGLHAWEFVKQAGGKTELDQTAELQRVRSHCYCVVSFMVRK